MFVFGLRSTSDDRPSDPSDESCPKYKKNGCQIIKKLNVIYAPPFQMRWAQDRNGMGMGWGWDRYGTGMGQGWDRMI